MSYIRPLSNPERLYIVGTGNGRVEIFDDPRLASLVLPVHVFEGLMKRWLVHHDDTSYRGAKLVEIKSENVLLPHNNDWRWVLTYKTWGKREVIAHKVTWFYIAQHIKDGR